MALRYFNFVTFGSAFAERTAAQRIEHVWFAPEIGRWVKRESMGTFHEELHTRGQGKQLSLGAAQLDLAQA